MNKEELGSTIIATFKEKEVMKEIGVEDNFFELGVSSLTIVELQIEVERKLGVAVLTSDLMRAQTMKEWIELYSQKIDATEDQTVA